MDTFRPHQLCPVCMAPHFPFCPPNHAPVVHLPQRYESFYGGQQASNMHHGAFNPHPAMPFGRAPLATPDAHFQGGRSTEFFPHQSYFPQGHPSNGSMYVDPRQGGPNGWIEDFAYEQQRRHADMGERPQSGERFVPRSHVAELPRVDANINVPDNRLGRGFRGDYDLNLEDARVQRDMTKHMYDMELLTGVAQGRSQYEPLNDALGDFMHGNNLPTQYETQGSYDSRGAQGYGSNRQKMSTPGEYDVLGDNENLFPPAGLQRREEEALADHSLFIQQGVKREDGLVHRRGYQVESYERRKEMQAQDSLDHGLLKKSLKRKQPLSREEELLIEKGLLDDDLSEPQLHESFPDQTQQGNEQFVSRCKPGGLEEKDIFCQQPGYQSSLTYAERETLATEFGEPGEHNYQRLQFLISEGQRNKRQEVEMEGGPVKLSGDWQPESLTARQVTWDGPLESRNSLESVGQHPRYEGVQTNKDILHRQYLEWEAEEKHMEALRRAERLAKEIQQREESVYQVGSLQSEHLQKQEGLRDSRVQAYHEHQATIRFESAEGSFEPNRMQHVSQQQQHDVSMQHPSHQHPRHHSDSESHFQEAHRQSQQHARDGFGQDAQIAEIYGGLQSRQHDNLVQLSEMSPQSRWLKEQTPYQPHFGPQRNSQAVPHHDQQSRSVHSVYPRPAPEELSQERSDRGSSLSFHNQLRVGTAHELPGSFPPLPSATSVNPPPPDSPPPPLPSAHPPSNETPPPPPPAAMFPSSRRTTSQVVHEYSQQSLPPDSQGLQESHRLLHTGVSQAHTLSQFQPQPPQPLENSKIVDAVNIFRNPGRLTRPDRFVVILRGLPGSGKSYLAKALRDVEVMNGGSAPRIHSMDDYFTCEVEKEGEVETGSGRSKKKIVKRVMEYCYEPEMEEAYRASMLKAFRKTLEEGMFKFVIVDDRNVLIADFAQFWAIAKRSGYEAFIFEAPYSDVKGCAARNVHNFTEQQIQSMTERWESTPSLYLKMEVSSLFRADDLNAQDIIEVDMDADDMERDLEEEEEEDNQSAQGHTLSLGSERAATGDRWEDKGDSVKNSASLTKLRSPADVGGGRGARRKSTDNALSGLMTTYGKKDKFVHWSDIQGVRGSSTGFSIGSSSHKTASLVIGPGPGYNGMSNLPVVGDDSNLDNPELRKSNKFVEQLRAEQEAFKAVFVRRRQRIGGMADEDDD